MSQFLDQVRIKIRSGDGGNGMLAWRREKYEPMGGPAGGNGGRGGDVWLEATRDLNTLVDFRFKSIFEAQPGTKGASKGMHGRNAPELRLRVPVGTIVRDLQTGKIIADLWADQQAVLIAEGGQGGRGNAQLASPTRRAPHYCEPGQPGIYRELELELKLLADVALVGLPNAGKSTLLAALTAARPKIANYPFSTLEPQLGVAKKPGGDGYVIADIPGLIEGASRGIGLGHKFLRHIERTRLLLHLVDISSEQMLTDIETINQELLLYSNRLSELPRIFVLNKSDLLDEQGQQTAIEDFRKLLADRGIKAQLVLISAAGRQGLQELSNLIAQELDRLPVSSGIYEIDEDLGAYEHLGQEFQVYRQKGIFIVEGDRVNRLVAVTDMKSPESLHHLHHVLRAMGVIDSLVAAGIQPGSEVAMGGISFVFGEELY
jgi:GTP-binding protein